jgi:hypothetical protein
MKLRDIKEKTIHMHLILIYHPHRPSKNLIRILVGYSVTAVQSYDLPTIYRSFFFYFLSFLAMTSAATLELRKLLLKNKLVVFVYLFFFYICTYHSFSFSKQLRQFRRRRQLNNFGGFY